MPRIRGCAACQDPLRVPGPHPYRLHRGPLDGGPLHRKIRPPGASRRRATDIHVTLLPYRYQSRRHNTARRTYHHRYIHPSVKEREEIDRQKREGRQGREKREREEEEEEKSSSILVTNRFEYVSFSVRQRCRGTSDNRARAAVKRLLVTGNNQRAEIKRGVNFGKHSESSNVRATFIHRDDVAAGIVIIGFEFIYRAEICVPTLYSPHFVRFVFYCFPR